jgi:hypothetical protein
LFGKVQSALIGQEIPDEIDLLETAGEIWNGISAAELPHVFRSRIQRVRRVTGAGGKYLTY